MRCLNTAALRLEICICPAGPLLPDKLHHISVQGKIQSSGRSRAWSTIVAGAKDSVAPDALYPAFREELVCTLLQTLINHPRAEAASRAGAVPDQAQEKSIAEAVQALSLQQTPPPTPGERHSIVQCFVVGDMHTPQDPARCRAPKIVFPVVCLNAPIVRAE